MKDVFRSVHVVVFKDFLAARNNFFEFGRSFNGWSP